MRVNGRVSKRSQILSSRLALIVTSVKYRSHRRLRCVQLWLSPLPLGVLGEHVDGRSPFRHNSFPAEAVTQTDDL